MKNPFRTFALPVAVHLDSAMVAGVVTSAVAAHSLCDTIDKSLYRIRLKTQGFPLQLAGK